MLRKAFMIVLAFILFLLQNCVFTNFTMGGIVPNLILLITCIFGFMHGEKTGMITGFLLGLLFDIFFGNFIGLHALVLTYVGYINGKFYGIYYPEDIKLPLVLVLSSNFSYEIIIYILTFLVRGRINIGYYFTHIILPEVLYTMLVSIIVYPLILLFYSYFEKKTGKEA